MKKIKEISISDYKLLSSVMIDRHYYFDIKIIYEDNSDKNLNKRYSEIEELYKILILKYPGCRIPSFPKKTFLMNLHINDEEKKEIIKNIEKFLRHIINHKVLCEKKIVNEFFANLSINKNQTLKTNMMKISEDDDINSSEFNVNENMNKDEKNINKEEQKEEKEDDIANDFEIIEFKKTENYDMWIEKNLLNMFIEEENSEKNGLIYKTKGIITSTYNYLLSNYSQENLNNNITENSITDSYFQEENLKYIEKISKELGEDDNINDYGKQIIKINEGLSYLIKNIINMKNYNQVKLKSLSNIKKLCQENIKNIKQKEKEKENFDDNDNIKIKINKKRDRKIFENEINNKLKVYIDKNNEFYEKDIKDGLDKINENKIVLEELKEIFERKKSHINFLTKLKSKLDDLEKKKELDPKNEALKKDSELINKYIDAEKEFINKLNKDLKYEIDFYKNNIENNVYKNINELYLKNYNTQHDIFNKVNEVLSLESDSENSSKDESLDNKEFNNDKNESNKEKNSDNLDNKKERKNSINSGDDF